MFKLTLHNPNTAQICVVSRSDHVGSNGLNWLHFDTIHFLTESMDFFGLGVFRYNFNSGLGSSNLKFEMTTQRH